jgi:hypothetical protein
MSRKGRDAMTKRECGSCSLCCKVLPVPTLYKPAGQWCKHFAAGTGCSIHQLRPKSCRSFECLWLQEEWLDDSWKPNACKFVMAYEYDGQALVIYPDNKTPSAWRAEPYQTVLRALAERHAGENRLVMIHEPKRRLILMPDQDIEAGDPAQPLAWQVTMVSTPQGPRAHLDLEALETGKTGGPMTVGVPAQA